MAWNFSAMAAGSRLAELVSVAIDFSPLRSCFEVAFYMASPPGLASRESNSLDGRGRFRLLPQQKFLDLPRGRFRQRPEHEQLRNFESREMRPAMLRQLRGRRMRALAQLDE